MLKIHHPKLAEFIKEEYTLYDIQSLLSFLEEQGTFEFPVLKTGLFPAAITSDDTAYTGYQQVWVRDNVHIAHAHYVIGEIETACHTAIALMTFFRKYRHRFDQILARPSLAQQVIERPHIRFDGNTLDELDQRWSHAQNDALGYFLWFYCKLVNEGCLRLTKADLDVLLLFPRYFQAIQYWRDEDQGHWEETAKIEASSIGTVIAGLREFQLMRFRVEDLLDQDLAFSFAMIEQLLKSGEMALSDILPYECRQPEKQRETDSALLFLIYPLNVVETSMADQIIRNVIEQLQGEIGIRRYLMDSFWAPDYKAKLSPEKRTQDMSDNMAERDTLAQAHKEAQWCLFDPTLSTIFGHRYHITGEKIYLQSQTYYLNRALSQLTGDKTPSGSFKCPELYYLEQEEYLPNDATPLLWTQANLRIALQTMLESLSLQ